ncbi:hypothetical protein [Ralstonia solanacearum]|uniref:hypothetical protein n=2 Tax=Ralstonia TaxID=48736 RepID=UPI0011D22C1E|nr:hypothetical protein [Ralstonia solanacearum]
MHLFEFNLEHPLHTYQVNDSHGKEGSNNDLTTRIFIMKTFIAVPNGVFPLKEVLAAPTTKIIIKNLSADPRTHGRKLRIFLSFYQTFDMVAQLQDQGVDPCTVDVEDIATAASFLIEKGFDKIIETFEPEDRALLDSLFQESEVSHV